MARGEEVMPTPYGEITTTQDWLQPAQEECTCAETKTNAKCEICEPSLKEEQDDL
jgi:hypothetical protein